MFIRPDEYIIIMEDDYTKLFSIEDLNLLRGGSRILYIPRAIEYKNGVLDERQFHDRIDYIPDDFKIIIPFYYGTSSKGIKETYKECLNLCNNNIQLVYAVPDGGEFLWDALLTKDYPKTDEQIIHEFIEAQELLIQQFGEMWVHLHNYLGVPNNWNNTHLTFLYEALRNRFPDVPFYSIQFSHFAVGNTLTDDVLQERIIYYHDKYGIKFFVGSQYCEGLSVNIEKAIYQKARGFITAPIHSLQKIKHTSVEPWMIEEIIKANRLFNEAS